jgi:hypothetical protein
MFYLIDLFKYLIRLCKFSIVRIVLNRSVDGGDSNAIVIAVKIQVILMNFYFCESVGFLSLLWEKKFFFFSKGTIQHLRCE